MRRKILLIAALCLSINLLAACSGKNGGTKERVLERSAVWTLGDRYAVNYSSLQYYATYDAKGELFYLKASRNAKETGMSKRVTQSVNEGGIVYALCESKQTDDNGDALYTYYECYTGSFCYVIGSETNGFHIENLLSMDDAIALIASPESPKSGVKFCESEWNAHYRTDACNLQILIRPNDNGALIKSLPSTYQAQTEGGESYYTGSYGDDIVYTDGVNSVQVQQVNRSGQEAANYRTVTECKAILALLAG